MSDTVEAHPAVPPVEGEAAGLVSRAVSAVVDALVVAVAILLGYVVFALVLLAAHPRRFTWPHAAPGLLASLGCVVAVLYLGASWSGTGRTIGDQFMGLRVLTVEGVRMRAWRALVRGFLYVVFPIGLLWCAVSRSRRSIQDLIVRSEVVYDWKPHVPSSEARSYPSTAGPVAPDSYHSSSNSPS